VTSIYEELGESCMDSLKPKVRQLLKSWQQTKFNSRDLMILLLITSLFFIIRKPKYYNKFLQYYK
jgi:hypothetical protein